MVTMSDVARRAGVSVSTVSYVLTGARPISAATRERVLAAMADLDYHPNALARGLASRRSSIVGLLLSATDHGLGVTETAFVDGANAAARDAGHHLLLCPLDVDDLPELTRLANERLVDGFLVMQVRLGDERVRLLQERGVPLVMIGRTADPGGIPHVDIDFDLTVERALDHLLGLGHRNLAYMNDSATALDRGFGPARRTQEAFRRLMADRGLPALALPCEATAEGGRRAVDEALRRMPDLTAVVVMNEIAAFGIVNELHDRGLDIPGDVSVVSLVSSPVVAGLANPPLTTLSSPGADIGRAAVEMLVSALGGGDPVAPQLHPCVLEVRGSTGPAPADATRRAKEDTPS